MCPQSFKKIYRDCRKIKLTEMGRQGRLAETAHPNKRPLTTEEMVAELVAIRRSRNSVEPTTNSSSFSFKNAGGGNSHYSGASSASVASPSPTPQPTDEPEELFQCSSSAVVACRQQKPADREGKRPFSVRSAPVFQTSSSNLKVLDRATEEARFRADLEALSSRPSSTLSAAAQSTSSAFLVHDPADGAADPYKHLLTEIESSLGDEDASVGEYSRMLLECIPPQPGTSGQTLDTETVGKRQQKRPKPKDPPKNGLCLPPENKRKRLLREEESYEVRLNGKLKAKGEEAFENATKSLNQREMVAEKGPTDSAIVVDDRTTAHIEDMPDFF